MKNADNFRTAYRELEDQMRALAEAKGNVFIPNPEPRAPTDYILICMEPSLGPTASSKTEAKVRVEAGSRNFLNSVEDFILHYCVCNYLCGDDEHYHITDLSKGAMLVDDAQRERQDRYDRWFPLLRKEIALVARPDAQFVTVGNVVADYLDQKPFPRPCTRIMHYSGQAGRARNKKVEGREDQFELFKNSVSLTDVIGTAEDILRSTSVPPAIRKETLSRLKERELTISRKKLIFIYKTAFEAIR